MVCPSLFTATQAMRGLSEEHWLGFTNIMALRIQLVRLQAISPLCAHAHPQSSCTPRDSSTASTLSRLFHCQSSWSGLGQTTFMTFQPLVSSSDCRGSLRTRPTSGSVARRGPTGLHRHPWVAKNRTVRIRRAAATNMAHSAACSSSAS